jgi:lipopolysaccharide transport system ATP-binding protein
MQDVAGEGRTILFVSHSMPAMQNLCHNGLVLSSGGVEFYGSINEAVQHYMSMVTAPQDAVADLTEAKGRFGTGEIRLQRFWIEDALGQITQSIPTGSSCSLVMEYEVVDGQPRRDIAMSVHINTITGAPVSLIHTKMLNQNFDLVPPHGYIRLNLPKLPLTVGRYSIDLNLSTYAGHTYADYIRNAAVFDIEEGDFYGTGFGGNTGAPVLLNASWALDELSGKLVK